MDIQLMKSILTMKCPRCRKTHLFDKTGLFVYRKILQMPENCSNCELKFEMEPGFWLGALWPSYPLLLIIEIPFLIMALYSTLGSPWISFALMILAFLIFWPVFLRIGRSIWIHIWVRYQPNYKS
jgi:uncharacterized protein (DUF983 family)